MSIFEGIGDKERKLFSKVVGDLEAAGGRYTVTEKGFFFKHNVWEFNYRGSKLTVDGIQLTYMNSFYTVIKCLRGWVGK